MCRWRLGDINFKRERSATEVETRIKFTLYLGVDSVGKTDGDVRAQSLVDPGQLLSDPGGHGLGR